jgi:4-hydroxy-3-methylbut-2-enyl diphosphate reductase
MRMVIAKYAGFCPGVKRAWGLVNESLKLGNSKVFILGELIHNAQALAFLRRRGLVTLNSLQDITKVGNGTLIIRAHGEPPKTYQEIKTQRIDFIDATCPCVTNVQKLAKDLSQKGFFIVVCGEKDHPEAIATVSYAKNGVIISSREEANQLSSKKKIAVICQTTFSEGLFREITKVLKNKCGMFKSCGTICNFTKLAQSEAKRLSKSADMAIVVGGKHSSNTIRLVEVCSKIIPTHHIETAEELKKEWFSGLSKVVVLAGASTPEWVIKSVSDRIFIND